MIKGIVSLQPLGGGDATLLQFHYIVLHLKTGLTPARPFLCSIVLPTHILMHIHILAFLLFFQSIVACQQVQENTSELAVDFAGQSLADSSRAPEKAPLPTANIIFQSIDGGQTWQDVSAELPGDKSVDCFLVQNGEVFLGDANGLYRSQITPAASVWEKEYMLNAGITDVFPGLAGPYAYSSRDGFFQNISKGIWISVFPDMKGQSVRTILETPDGTVFVGRDNGIFKSADHGKTWKHVFEDGIVLNMVASGGVLLGGGQQGILRSTDGGEHWDWVLTEGGVGISTERIAGGFAAITYNTESKTRRVRISTDGGKTWLPIDAGLPPQASIASIKQVGEVFFCGHPDGIFRSDDRGKTWKLVLPAVGKKVFNLSVSGNVMYAIPRDGGC